LEQVEVWEHSRAAPISRFTWGGDVITSVRFNPAEPDLFASTASDRSVALYDLRSATPLRKFVMQVREKVQKSISVP
jgi:DDB1- and CUL4-associated factor 13